MRIKTLTQIGVPLLFLVPLSLYAANDTTISQPVEIKTEEASTTNNQDSVKTFTECSQQAIEDRDTAIANSRSIYNTAMAKALTERKNREKAAIAAKTEDEKKAAIKASVELYKNQTKNAQNTLTQARKLAWQTFENDIEECRQLQDIDDSGDKSTLKEDQKNVPVAQTLKKEDREVNHETDKEVKTIKNSIKSQFESFKSLFKKD